MVPVPFIAHQRCRKRDCKAGPEAHSNPRLRSEGLMGIGTAHSRKVHYCAPKPIRRVDAGIAASANVVKWRHDVTLLERGGVTGAEKGPVTSL